MLNVIRVFIDTEFTDFINADLISIGASADNGMDFYGENTDFIQEYSSDWVKSNIYPLLDFSEFGMKRAELSARLWSWIEELKCDGVIITFDFQIDATLLCNLFDNDKHPKIVGFENIFNNFFKHADKLSTEYDTGEKGYQELSNHMRDSFDLSLNNYFSIPTIRRHHALDDAIGNKLAYHYISQKHGVI